jgi:uncharacterized protein YdeI (YjbR/CyaY-like superfamily)
MQKIPADIRKAVTVSKKVQALWDDLTPISRRDFISWIESAKQEETRARRAARVGDMLMEGKRRPCCYAVVPMNFYTALGESTKAKTQWKTLTADQKRDFTDWIGSVENKTISAQRVEKACALLAAGKMKP